MNSFKAFLVFFILCIYGSLAALAHDHESPQVLSGVVELELPDVDVTDQNGTQHKLVSGLIGNKAAVISFIFTRCSTSCPVITANLRALQDRYKERAGKDLVFISISVDPSNDTPDVLKKFASQFDPLPGWSFVRAEGTNFDDLRKALKFRDSSPLTHTTQVFIGLGGKTTWLSRDGTAKPEVLEAAVESLPNLKAKEDALYFTNLPLIDQNGMQVRFYDDVLRGKNALIVSIYTNCHDACPVAVERVRASLNQLPPEIRSSYTPIAISVDPENDGPKQLAQFAKDHSLVGWQLLTGKKENVDWVLFKLGLYVDDYREHSTVLLAGSDKTHAWLKALAIADPTDITAVLTKFAQENTVHAQ